MASQCLYQILGIETTANIEEIRFAYRRLALKWHPDKIQQSGASPEACEEATTRFQEIGRAYEVLADPAERAWYDSHRSQILSSAASPSGASTDFDFNLWPYFSPAVFSGYEDTGQGFYAVYRDVFQNLHQQETAFARAYGVRAAADPPDMGGVETSYPQVSKFYTYWLGFSTVKDFSWCDEYRTTLAPNRKTRRFLEEENKKIRSKARKEFNDVVRRLAAFVKKRDKRVLERQREVQRLEKEREEMLKLKRKKMEAEKILKAREHEEAEWTKVSISDLVRDDDGESDIDDNIGSYDWGREATKSTSRKENQEEYYCIVCSKKFKSDEQWRNHERSKKHVDRVASLKDSFKEDDGDVETRSLSAEPQEANEEILTSSTKENSEDRKSLVSVNRMGTPDGLGLHIEEIPVLKTPSITVVPKDSTFGTDNKDVPGTLESSSSDVDFEDDESSSLLLMLNSYTKRQQKDSSSSNSSSGRAHCDTQEPAKDGEEGEIFEETDLHENREQCDDNIQKSDALGSDTSSLGEDVIEVVAEGNAELDCEKTKRKSKVRMRLERKQAASLGRHAKLAEVLSFQRQVDRTALNYEALGIDEDANLLKERLQDEPLLPDKIVSGDNAPLEDKLDGSSDKNSGQVASNKQRWMTKSNMETSHAAAQKDQERLVSKGKTSKGGSKKLRIFCETCGKDFESRNLLFKHIDASNHSVLKGK